MPIELNMLNNKNKNQVNMQDKRCAPHIKFSDNSCIRLALLIELAKAYNKENKNNMIELNETKESTIPKIYKRFLVAELTEKLKNNCSTQKCWSKQSFIKHMDHKLREELIKYTWRPEGPDTGNQWLNTKHINDVMKQYEKKYENFEYLGTMPRDFQNHEELKQTDEFYLKLWKSGKTKFGMIYNTDKHGGSGEHWNAVYVDFDLGEVYFFDSYGVEPPDDVRKNMRGFKKLIEKNSDKIVSARHNHNNLIGNGTKISLMKRNNIRHQYKGSECGVYSINFILRMLRGDTFEEICKSKIKDDHINKCRKVYFRK